LMARLVAIEDKLTKRNRIESVAAS